MIERQATDTNLWPPHTYALVLIYEHKHIPTHKMEIEENTYIDSNISHPVPSPKILGERTRKD